MQSSTTLDMRSLRELSPEVLDLLNSDRKRVWLDGALYPKSAAN